MNTQFGIICFCLLLSIAGFAQPNKNISQYNVVWDTPSEGSMGSMPLGNGDIGLNVWVEKNGDLLFYISKVDAFDFRHYLPKLGRIRIKMEPALQIEKFKQTLNLIDASALVEAGDVKIRLWVDANNPIIRVEGKSRTPRSASITLEPLRQLIDANEPLPAEGTAGVLFNDNNDRLAWCYRNQSSLWGENIRKQNSPEMVARAKDPILYRTSGALLMGKGLIRKDPTTLASKEKTTTFDCSISINSSQPENLQAWLNGFSEPVPSDWTGHCAYWKSFWNRSYINITSGGTGKFNLDHARFTQFHQGTNAFGGLMEVDAAQNVFQISQRYALERFCQAAASRGEVPPPFNGSIFTMDMPAGTHEFINKGARVKAVNADYRDWWGLPFFWQNTRHPVWSMLARGDYDAMMPAFKLAHGSLDIGRDRAMKWFGHEGSFMTEGIFWKGVSVFNNLPDHLKHHFLGTIEITTMMCEYYEHTGDQKFVADILLPCADEFLKFYELHFPKRDKDGRMIMEPAGVTETYSAVTNPVTEVSGLRYLLTKLLSFDGKLTGEERKVHWTKLLEKMPEISSRRVRGLELLAPGLKYSGRLICETPELYAVWPFRQTDLVNNTFLSNARQSFHVRQLSLDGIPDVQTWETGGWQSAPVWAAYLGLPRETARLVSINFDDRLPDFTFRNDRMEPPVPNHPRARFPGFWETKMDYTPDNDHGGVSANAVQSMLLQSSGRKIILLPAWPENWDVSFKLHAAFNTTVECEFKDGKVKSLKVNPESRRADIVDMTTLQRRIRTLVEVALADHNYLFGVPPMLDAQPMPGKTTAAWITKYGYTLQGCKAGPWINTVFNGSTVYVHIPEWPKEGVRLSAIPRTLISSKSITGNIQVKQNENGWLLTGTPDPLNTIVKLEFDKSVEEIANALPSKGSFTINRERKVSTYPEGRMVAEINLQEEKMINRFEFTIDNPGYVWGGGKPFELQIKSADEIWRTVYKGNVYGIICGKQFDPVKANAVRLVIQAAGIKQLDVF